MLNELSEIEQKELLLQLSTGSEQAFSRLFHCYSNKLYSFIYAISASRQLAEDTVQEVFLKIWEKRFDAQSINQFDSYLFRMARNQALNAFKKMSKESLLLFDLGQHSESSHEISGVIEYKEIELSVKEAVEKLPNKQKQVFILSREHGLKQADISRLLHITVPTVKSHITQAVHFIRKECKNIYPPVKLLLIFLSCYFS